MEGIKACSFSIFTKIAYFCYGVIRISPPPSSQNYIIGVKLMVIPDHTTNSKVWKSFIASESQFSKNVCLVWEYIDPSSPALTYLPYEIKRNKCELLWTCDKLQWTYHNSAKIKGELANYKWIDSESWNRLMGTEKSSSQNREIGQKSRFWLLYT